MQRTKTSAAAFAILLLCPIARAPIARAQAKSRAETASALPPAGPSAEDRQKAVQADMKRLLQLARQLKAEVDKARKDELSIQVIRDADEIDRLARSTRGRIP